MRGVAIAGPFPSDRGETLGASARRVRLCHRAAAPTRRRPRSRAHEVRDRRRGRAQAHLAEAEKQASTRQEADQRAHEEESREAHDEAGDEDDRAPPKSTGSRARSRRGKRRRTRGSGHGEPSCFGSRPSSSRTIVASAFRILEHRVRDAARIHLRDPLRDVDGNELRLLFSGNRLELRSLQGDLRWSTSRCDWTEMYSPAPMLAAPRGGPRSREEDEPRVGGRAGDANTSESCSPAVACPEDHGAERPAPPRCQRSARVISSGVLTPRARASSRLVAAGALAAADDPPELLPHLGVRALVGGDRLRLPRRWPARIDALFLALEAITSRGPRSSRRCARAG